MAKSHLFKSELAWELMNSHVDDDDGGLEAADAALTRLEAIAELRDRRPEPELEAALAEVHLEYEEFAAWYDVAYRIRHYQTLKGWQPRTAEQTETAYKRYAMGRIC